MLKIFAIILFWTYFVAQGTEILALYNPLEVPNNRMGVHILYPSEVFQASQLVNSNGGDWGYVTIPMRSDDRDFIRWQAFFKATKEFHLIPIIRLATYPINNVWAEPTSLDIIDFVNFLNLFTWPVENRYVILFNEPNHSREWGGLISPENYVKLAKLARDTFKNASSDYFLLSAGLDMSAPTNHTSIDALNYYRRMFAQDSNWPDYFDGFSFHPYPNPAFSASPYTSNRYGIRSYEYELSLLRRYGVRPKFLFFTETGTIRKNNFYSEAFTSVWRDNRIVAITPFILYAAEGEFASFSLLNQDHTQTVNYREISNLPKILGQPKLVAVTPSAAPAYMPPENSPDQNPVRSWWSSVLNFIVK